MSVRKSERSQGKLQVLNLAKDLCVYTLTICRNEKVFPKSERWLITSKIAGEAVDTLSCIRRANAVLVGDGVNASVDYAYRRAQQIEAHAHINALLSLIDISFTINNIEASRIEYWTHLAVETDEKLKAWMRSDKDRFNKTTK
jgi:hypothetical protein